MLPPPIDGRSTIQSVYALAKGRGILPEHLLPFAVDPGGNFFCIDLEDASVVYYLNDTWDTDLSRHENQKKSMRKLTDNFEEFANSLTSEEQAFG